MVIALMGLLSVHPVFAHTFVKDSDADLIAKIQEFKVESKLLQIIFLIAHHHTGILQKAKNIGGQMR